MNGEPTSAGDSAAGDAAATTAGAAAVTPAGDSARARLKAVTLDRGSIGHGSHHIEHEREVAIFDILDGNVFGLVGRGDGPYALNLSIVDDRLVFNVASDTDPAALVLPLSLVPFKRLIRDYFVVCDTYYEAIRSAPPSRIQAIDMGRRSLHDDGSRLLIDRLADKITIDHATARRLFTLIAALHWKG
jgi:uncharacterized protein (UPF0262 family)